MSTLIPNIQWNSIKEMTPEQRRLMRACEVFDGDVSRDENYIYTHISRNPYDSIVADRIRTKAEYLGVSTNSIYPLEEIKEVSLYEKRVEAMAHAREAKKKKVLMEV